MASPSAAADAVPTASTNAAAYCQQLITAPVGSWLRLRPDYPWSGQELNGKACALTSKRVPSAASSGLAIASAYRGVHAPSVSEAPGCWHESVQNRPELLPTRIPFLHGVRNRRDGRADTKDREGPAQAERDVGDLVGDPAQHDAETENR